MKPIWSPEPEELESLISSASLSERQSANLGKPEELSLSLGEMERLHSLAESQDENSMSLGSENWGSQRLYERRPGHDVESLQSSITYEMSEPSSGSYRSSELSDLESVAPYRQPIFQAPEEGSSSFSESDFVPGSPQRTVFRFLTDPVIHSPSMPYSD